MFFFCMHKSVLLGPKPLTESVWHYIWDSEWHILYGQECFTGDLNHSQNLYDTTSGTVSDTFSMVKSVLLGT